jgi:hypothetical protein
MANGVFVVDSDKFAEIKPSQPSGTRMSSRDGTSCISRTAADGHRMGPAAVFDFATKSVVAIGRYCNVSADGRLWLSGRYHGVAYAIDTGTER